MNENSMKKLNQSTIHLLASSQVITSMDTVVKELVENSLDAGAIKIDVKLVKFGLEKIQVSDNGSGIEKDDVNVICLPHYTSKIKSIDDLQSLTTFGFRGEALHSLCCLANVAITSKTKGDVAANVYSFMDDGRLDEEKTKLSAACDGTSVVVTNLFKSLPVRKQFYKNERKLKEELKKIEWLLMAYSIAYPHIRFSLFNDSNIIFSKNSFKDIKDVLRDIWRPITFNMMQYMCENEPEKEIKIETFLPLSLNSMEKCTISDKCFIIVNNRPVMMQDIDKVIKDKIRSLGINQTVCYCIIINISTAQVDVNVEPNKSTVLFNRREHVFNILSKILDKMYDIQVEDSLETRNNNDSAVKEGAKTKITNSTEVRENLRKMDDYFSNRIQKNLHGKSLSISEIQTEKTSSMQSANDSVRETWLSKNGNNDLSILDKDSQFETNWRRGSLRTESNEIIEPVQLLVSKNKRTISPLKENNSAKKKCFANTSQSLSLSVSKNVHTKQPFTAYTMFARDIRKTVIDENPTCDFMKINSIISQKWETLENEQRRKYEEVAGRNKTRKLNIQSPNMLRKVVPLNIEKPRKDDRRIVNINFDLEKTKCFRPSDVTQPKTFEVIGKLKDGLWVVNFQNCIGTWNQYRGKEKELYNNLLENHQLIPKALEIPTVLTEGLTGQKQWAVLNTLQCKQDFGIYHYVNDPRIDSNGIRIKKWHDRITNFHHAEITHITDCISYYGVNDLIEILSKIVADDSITLAQSRPLQVTNYFKGEAVRLSRQLPAKTDKSKVEVSVEHALKHVSNLTEFKCLHGQHVFSPFYDLGVSDFEFEDDF